MIDLRSDTVTQPSAAMRAAMAAAPVGDDVYGEDPTVRELEERVAALLGQGAGLFCPSGSMANLLGVRLLAGPGEEVVCDAQAHIARAELGAHGALSGLTMRTFSSPRGLVDAELVRSFVAPDAGPYLVSTTAVAVENTHNFGGGTVQPLDQLAALAAMCRELRIGAFLDGARLWNAHVATGVPLEVYGGLFDVVTVCFSKGLGAPVGSMVVAGAEQIARARVLRKRLGGGMRQVGILAAGALHALDHNLARLAEDHAGARAFAAAVAARSPAAVDPAGVATNIVVVDTGALPAAQVAAGAAERGVRVAALGPRLLRAVTHLDVTLADCVRAGEVVGDLLI